VRVAHPRRLVNFFPESALEPEKPSTPVLTAAAKSPTSLASQPAAMVSDVALHDAASPALGATPAASIDSTSLIREPYELPRSELLAAIRAGGGPALLTGPARVGKTTLCRAVVQELDRRTVASIVSGAPQSFDDLLKMMLVDFGVMTTESSAAAHAAQSMLMNTLDCFLESLVAIRATAVVFIDDAHKIPADVLAELAAMRAPGTPSARVLQLVLVGRPSLRSLLKRADLQSLDASIVRRMNLVPVRVHEPAGDTARSAAVDLSLKNSRTPSPLFKRLLLIAAVTLVVLAGVLWVWRDAVSRTILQ
jgi:type II secretory pathway predicted ATPase ExeA